MCITHLWMLEEARRGFWISRTGATDACEPPRGYWESVAASTL